ncbi:MAG TPA: lactonase family protein [Tepidisphaeraceae bacterium]|jgi:6-phosphogluconolactonase|nr:lactonase family protein [Tepidisphaeraceae bacterium]
MEIGFYIGTYTGKGSEGIYFSRLDSATGQLAEPALAARTDNPSFLALHPTGNHLYAVNENNPSGMYDPAVSAFALDRASSNLSPLNRQPSHGAAPTHLSVDPTGRCVLVANYGSGSFASMPIRPDGSLGPVASKHQDTGGGPVADRQNGPHAHGIWPMPEKGTPAEQVANGLRALGCDLGTDQLRLFRLDAAAAEITPADPPFFAMPPGTGPRHIAFSRDRRFLYAVGELANTLSVLDITDAQFRLVQSLSTVSPRYPGKAKAAEVVLHPTANILYVTNRGPDDLVTYALDPSTGHLRELGRLSTSGDNPRDFAVDPTGKWVLVANEYSNSIAVFGTDPTTRQPYRTGSKITVSSPVCILFVP